MSVITGTMYCIEEKIRAKLKAVGATSNEKAVTPEEANLDLQEQNWIHYIAGGMFAKVKKAANNLYYITN